MGYGKGKLEEFGGKNLHSILITETYWSTSLSASTLYSALISAEALTPGKIKDFIKNFNTFFFNTYVEISEDNEKLVHEIETKFSSFSLFRNKGFNYNQLFSLLDLWKRYNIQVQQNPIMELIRHTAVMGDKEW